MASTAGRSSVVSTSDGPTIGLDRGGQQVPQPRLTLGGPVGLTDDDKQRVYRGDKQGCYRDQQWEDPSD
ncbi:hypothetical protein RRG08_025953 [Elysia crispata]|uniref:Uncharacterized protein n=1 Tax=Elysia crispata TaxID=231223 RepID=A0AAE0ZG01_9GAST|nr:hypothetical protein RRG08_025953 [Elysia crispata]